MKELNSSHREFNDCQLRGLGVEENHFYCWRSNENYEYECAVFQNVQTTSSFVLKPRKGFFNITVKSK